MIGASQTFFIVFFLILALLLMGYLKYFADNANWKRQRVLLGGYVVLLLVSLVVFQLIPDKGFADNAMVTAREVDEAYQAIPSIYEAAQHGRINRVPGVSSISKWSFDFGGETLKIVNDTGDYHIVTQTGEVKEGQIEVVQYSTRYIVAGLDLTDRIKPARVELTGNELKINAPEPGAIQLFAYGDAFIAQFKNDRDKPNIGFNMNEHSVHGQQVLILSVPANVEVIH